MTFRVLEVSNLPFLPLFQLSTTAQVCTLHYWSQQYCRSLVIVVVYIWYVEQLVHPSFCMMKPQLAPVLEDLYSFAAENALREHRSLS
jgi:hypothetical protein